MPLDFRVVAEDLLRQARARGADAADALVAEGTEFSVTLRHGEIETLKEAGSKALGLRVFVGRRSATAHTSDFSEAALRSFVTDVVALARMTGEDPAAGLPDQMVPPEEIELGLFDPAAVDQPTPDRIDSARHAEAAALAVPGITNSHGSSYSARDGSIVLANTSGFLGSYRASACSLSVVPVAEREGQMERDHWYTVGRGPGQLLPAEEVGRIAAERTLRRLGARKVKTEEVPVVFDPETAAELLGHLFGALSGGAVFRNASFLKGRLGETVASPLLTVIDDGRRPGGLGARPFDGEGLPTRRNVPLERGVLRHYLCDTYAARKLGVQSTGSARRGVAGSPSVGAGDLYLEPGPTPPDRVIGEMERGLYVTDLIGFGVDLVSGDYSQGAAGHWIENGRLVFPVHEVTIAGNLKQMLLDVDAVGDDLEFRGSVNAPTLRVRRMTVSGD